MSWNPTKRLSSTRQRLIQENLQKLHARSQHNKENIPPSGSTPMAAASSGSNSVLKKNQKVDTKVEPEPTRRDVHRRELHNARRRERRLRDTKETLQARLKMVEAERKKEAAAAKTQLEEVEARATSKVANAEARASAAEVRAWEAEARVEGEVLRLAVDMDRRSQATELEVERAHGEAAAWRQVAAASSASLLSARTEAAVTLEHHRQSATTMLAQVYGEANIQIKAAEARADDAALTAHWETETARAQVQAAAQAVKDARREAEDTVGRVHTQLGEYTAQLEARAHSMVANVTWLAGWLVTEIATQTRVQVADAEQRVYKMETRTANAIKEERARSEAERAQTELWAEEAVAEVEGRLSAAMEEAHTYLEDARQVIAMHADEDGELTEQLRMQLDDAVRTADRLRSRTAVLQKQNRALRARVDRATSQKERAVEKASIQAAAASERPSLVLKEGGVVPDATRCLIRDMIELGLKVDQVKGAVHAVTRAIGVTVEGDVSSRSVRRIVLEGLVASRVQIATESNDAQGITVSGDGTTNRNINYDSRYLHLNTGEHHERRFLGIHSAPNHTSDTQLHGWQALTETVFNTYNASPRGQADPIDARTFLQKVHGMLTDHAEDQKRLKKLFEEWKHGADRELRGEQAMEELAPLDILPVLAEETAAAVELAGGAEAWSQLSPAELAVENAALRKSIIRRLGETAYNNLSDTDKEVADLFIHAGCCMHKELNAVKGGNTRLMKYWGKTGAQPPILLMNRDNDAATRAGSVAKAQAEKRSCGGAVKLAELAGALFHHKDDKRGQQDATRFFFESTLGFQFSFPDTSNTRYQSYCEASGELLVHLLYYRDFLEIVRDKKDSGRFNHLESNVWKGLHDVPTLTELCVLALYGQAISHPYIRKARGPQDGLTNHLSLGPLHDHVKSHIVRLIAKPELLLAPDVSYTTGCLDGELWERPEVIVSIHQIMRNLPHLKSAFVEFLRGSLETWERFTAEFAPGGTIAKLSASQRDLAWMPSTNDENEGALGAYRIGARDSPNMSLGQHNARQMYKLNDTSTFIATSATPEEHRFYRSEARVIDSSGLEKKRRGDIAAESERVAKKRKGERDARAAKKAARRAQLESVQIITDLLQLTMEKTTVKLLDEQLDWHRMFVDTGPKEKKQIPIKKLLPTKDLKIRALVAAVERYNSVPKPPPTLTSSPGDDVAEDDGYSSDEGQDE